MGSAWGRGQEPGCWETAIRGCGEEPTEGMRLLSGRKGGHLGVGTGGCTEVTFAEMSGGLCPRPVLGPPGQGHEDCPRAAE